LTGVCKYGKKCLFAHLPETTPETSPEKLRIQMVDTDSTDFTKRVASSDSSSSYDIEEFSPFEFSKRLRIFEDICRGDNQKEDRS
jgi:hypothetical protein